MAELIVPDKIYTLQEFETVVAENPNRLLELINGKIVEKVTSDTHGMIAINIGSELRQWLKRTGIKGHYGTQVSHRRQNDTRNERLPDVSFRFSDEGTKDRPVEGMPDFAVEIKSRGNSLNELRDKVRFYLANGTHLAWIVIPSQRKVEVYTDAASESTIIDGEMVLSGGETLPDFSITLDEVFFGI